MARNPDPKPGRWVLPLVVLGMVLFTWIWVNRLGVTQVDDASDASSTTTTAAAPGEAEEVTEPAAETTTTTQLSPEMEIYLSNLAEDKQALAELSAEMNAVNQDWEDRRVTYSEAGDNMAAVSEQALVFSTAVEDHRPSDQIAGLVDAHQVALDRAVAVAEAAEAVLAGLRAPDDGELRRAALVEFRAAAASFDQAADQIEEIILQSVQR